MRRSALIKQVVFGIAFGIIAALLIGRAHAHDPDTGEPNWITHGQYSSPETGVHCCGPKDCDRLDPKAIEATPAGYILHAFGDELVPYREATPSEDGAFWRCHTYTGSRRCFFAPAGTQ